MSSRVLSLFLFVTLGTSTALPIHANHLGIRSIGRGTIRLNLDTSNLFFFGTDPASVPIPQISDAVADYSDGFFRSFSSRFLGAIVGNIFAGTALTFISVKIAKIFAATKNGNTKTKTNRPVEVNKREDTKISGDRWLCLFACLAIDFIGDTSFLLPGIGEAEDVVWAPIAAVAVSKIFGSNFLVAAEFIKEILPGTDILPLATLAWIVDNVIDDSDLAKLLNLGIARRKKQM